MAKEKNLKKTLLLDFSNIAHANFYTASVDTRITRDMNPFCNERLQYWKYLMVKKLKYIMKIHKPHEMVICCDSPSWRKRYFKYYKANRTKTRARAGFDYVEFLAHLDKFIDEIDGYLPYKIMQIPHCEADDIIAILANHINNDVLICSNDHDMKQLLAIPDVKLWSIQDSKFMACDDPKQYLIEHILMGDSGDGVPSVVNPDNIYVQEDMVFSKQFETWFKKHIKKNAVESKDLIELELKYPDTLRELIRIYEFKVRKNARIKRRATQCGAKKVNEILEYGIKQYIDENGLKENFNRNKKLIQLDIVAIPPKLWDYTIKIYSEMEDTKPDFLKVLQYIRKNNWTTIESDINSFMLKPMQQSLTDIFNV